MFVKQSEEFILSWLNKKDFEKFGRYLLSGSIHGKAGVPVAELGRIEKIIKKNYTDEQLYKFGKIFLARNEYTVRNIGAHLVVSGWPKFKDVETFAKMAANDDDWIVREYAAGTFAALLEKDFSYFSKVYLKWVKSESINVKRAIALAVKYDSKLSDPKKWKSYYSLINPLLSEDAEYIRKNLGPFTVGDGLLSRYPEQVLKACQKWKVSKDANVRWNTAMIFTAAAAKKFKKQGMFILKSLENDQDGSVAKAAAKGLKNLK